MTTQLLHVHYLTRIFTIAGDAEGAEHDGAALPGAAGRRLRAVGRRRRLPQAHRQRAAVTRLFRRNAAQGRSEPTGPAY